MTFVELVVVSAFLLVIMSLVWAFVTTQTKTFGRESARSTSASALRVWTDRFVRDVRRAGYDPLETNTATSRTFDLETATTVEVTFTADVDRDGTLDSGPREHLGYRLNGSALERWQGGSSWRVLTDGVQSFSLTYFDSAGNVLDPDDPLFSTRNVVAIEMTLTARAEDRTGPIASAPLISRTVQASLRNLP